MKKRRIYEVAKEFNISGKEVLNILEQLGKKVSSPLASIDEETEMLLKQKIVGKSVEGIEHPEKRLASVKKRVEISKKGKKITFFQKPEKFVKPAPPTFKREERKQPVKKEIVLSDKMTIKEVSQELGIRSGDIIKFLLTELGLPLTINQTIEKDVISLIGEKYGFEINFKEAEEDYEKYIEKEIIESDSREENLLPRPPIVTILGHVDHGKTKLLDYIRSSNVIETEAGGITQHIGAYQVEVNDKKITFLDTPGHEAFTALRARGAKVTDIAVLVVAGDEGVMPQTVEAINHAKEANVPIIVAINKIDKPNVNIDRVKKQLAEYELVSEDWGGDTIVVPISAKDGTGVNELLEMIILVAELKELKASTSGPVVGVIIEAGLDKNKGVEATVLIQRGTLKVGDYVIAGVSTGRIRAMMNDKGLMQITAPPSTPVKIFGLTSVPTPGDKLITIDEKKAKVIAEHRKLIKKEQEALPTIKRISIEELYNKIEYEKMKELKVILKCDTYGSSEAIKKSFENIKHKEIRLNVIHSGVGDISDSDVLLSVASGAVILGFQVKVISKDKKIATRENVSIMLYKVIYDLINDIKKLMGGLLGPKYVEVLEGTAEIKQVFYSSRAGNIAGCQVSEGRVNRDCVVKVFRNNQMIFEGKIESLKRFKEDVSTVSEGMECGILISKFNNICVGDILKFYSLKKEQREDEI